jgi:hypothetical protein
MKLGLIADGMQRKRHIQAQRSALPLSKKKKKPKPKQKKMGLRTFCKGAARRRRLDWGQEDDCLDLHFQTTLSLLREAKSAQAIFYWLSGLGLGSFTVTLEARAKNFFLGFSTFLCYFGHIAQGSAGHSTQFVMRVELAVLYSPWR